MEEHKPDDELPRRGGAFRIAFRAYVGLEDALRAFLAYAAGSDEWRRLCEWKDVTLEFESRPVTLVLILVAALAAAGVFLWLVL